jgi:outer membrane protein assembly complex protein YaeT
MKATVIDCRRLAQRVRCALIAAGCLALFLCASPSFAQMMDPGAQRGPVIADVIIVGANSISRDRLIPYLYTKKGQPYSDKIARDDFNRLAESHLCRPKNIRTDPTNDGRVIVYFEVKEYRSIVQEVVYRHNKHVTTKELEGITRVHRGMPLDKTLNRMACIDITQHLVKQGYIFANVTLLEGDNDDDERVVFNITEGHKVQVNNTSFVGQSDLASEDRLRTQIDTNRAFLGFGGTYQPEMVQNDITKIVEYYRSNGYLNVQVSRELKFSDDFRTVDIVFHIHEGLRYRVANWSIEINKDSPVFYPNDELASVVQLKKGDYYNEGVVKKDIIYISDWGGWRGNQMEVKQQVTEVPDNPGLVLVQYVVEQKPPAYVGQVIIIGNPVTQDRVIRRVIELYPGQVLQYPDLRIAENNLARLNIFEMKPEEGVRPTVTVLDSPGPFKDILVKVQDTRTGSLMLGAGINSDSGLVGSIVLNERNFDIFRIPESWADFFEGKAFRGAGQEFRIEAVPGTEVQRYTVSLREPFLFDQPYSLLVSAYYRDRIFNEYTENRYGTRWSLSHLFTKEWSASVGFRLEEINVNNIEAGAPIDYTSQYGSHFLVAPNFAITYDTRNSYVRPSEGGKAEFMFEQVFGDNTFPIFNLELSRYFTLWQRPDGSGKHILALHSQFSYAYGDVPVYERFFAGGYNSMRGFEFRGVGPYVNGFNVGGNFQWLNSVEYQLPIRANDMLYMVGFIDSGTVERDIGILNYRVAAGVGLRIALPMLGPVPIALDFGFPIVTGPGDQRQLFSFWLGIAR